MEKKLDHVHLTLIIVAVIAIVVVIGIFRPGITGFIDIQERVSVRLNLTVATGICILNANLTEGVTGTLAYGSAGSNTINPGTVTDELSINLTSAGNARYYVSVNASFWQGPNGTGSLYCNNTRYHNVSGTAWGAASDACGGATAMLLGAQVENKTNITYLKVNVPSIALSGRHNQNVSYTISSCGV